MPAVRTIKGDLHFAKAIPAGSIPPTQSLQQKQGIRYEKRVVKALATYALESGYSFQAGPWFTFRDDEGEGLCVPDAAISTPAQILLVEVKLTYTPAAFTKLSLLYAPVVSRALQRPCSLLIICKHMSPGAPHGAYGLKEALCGREPVMQWLGYGKLPV